TLFVSFGSRLLEHLKDLFLVDIKCEVSAWLIFQYVCYCYRPGPIRADAFRGHGLSLLEKTTLRSLRTRAIPAGVTALLSPGLVKLLREKVLYHYIQLKNCGIGKCYTGCVGPVNSLE